MNLSRTFSVFLLLTWASIPMVSAQEPLPPPVTPKVDPQEAHDAAVKELDRLEALDADEITPASMEALNKHLSALQIAEPGHPRLTYLFARAYVLSGRPKDAIEQLRRFVDTREGRTEWEAHRRLGDLFVDEFPQLAKASYNRAAEMKAGEPTVLVGLSMCAYKVGRIEEAVKLAKDAADADGRKSVRVMSHLGRMLIAQHDWAEADRAVKSAMELAEAQVKSRPGARTPLRTMDAQCKLGVDLIQARIGDQSAGADDFVRLARLFRRRNDLASTINLHECVRILEAGVNATTANPSPKLLQEYAAMLAEVGRSADALAAYEKLLIVDPNNTAAKEALEKLRTAAKPGN